MLPVVQMVSSEQMTSSAPFRFLDLAVELQVQILHHVIPHGRTFTILPSSDFVLSPSDNEESQLWSLCSPPVPGLPDPLRIMVFSSDFRSCVPTGILSASRDIAEKALEIFYGENKFQFRITRVFRKEQNWFNGVTMFPPVASAYTKNSHTSAFAYLREFEIVINDNLCHHGVYKTLRRNLTEAVARLAESNNIRRMKIVLHSYSVDHYCHFGPRVRFGKHDKLWYQYVLEPFAALSNIERVEISGDVTSTFATKLSAVMQGVCAKPDEMEYPKHKVLRKKPGLHWDPMCRKSVSKRKWYDAELNWDAVVLAKQVKRMRVE